MYFTECHTILLFNFPECYKSILKMAVVYILSTLLIWSIVIPTLAGWFSRKFFEISLKLKVDIYYIFWEAIKRIFFSLHNCKVAM